MNYPTAKARPGSGPAFAVRCLRSQYSLLTCLCHMLFSRHAFFFPWEESFFLLRPFFIHCLSLISELSSQNHFLRDILKAHLKPPGHTTTPQVRPVCRQHCRPTPAVGPPVSRGGYRVPARGRGVGVCVCHLHPQGCLTDPPPLQGPTRSPLAKPSPAHSCFFQGTPLPLTPASSKRPPSR